jgi:hypothetical protein
MTSSICAKISIAPSRWVAAINGATSFRARICKPFATVAYDFVTLALDEPVNSLEDVLQETWLVYRQARSYQCEQDHRITKTTISIATAFVIVA